MKLSIILSLTLAFMFAFMFATIQSDTVDAKRYIDKSQCIGLLSSDVNDYYACKKDVKK